MKSKLLLLIIFITFNCYPQQRGIVRYGFINALGVGNARGQENKAYMIFTNEKSYFVTAKDSLESDQEKYLETTINSKDKKTTVFNMGMKVSDQGDQVLFDLTKKTILSNVLYRRQLYVNEPTPKINWKITKESKKIGKYQCLKATTTFRGRNYIAWFTREIPVQFGPWKLNGLPGLILEAYDKNKNVYWGFKSIEYPTFDKKNGLSLRKSKSEKKIVFYSYKDFKKEQIKEIELAKDKNKILTIEHKGITFNDPKLADMFIECE